MHTTEFSQRRRSHIFMKRLSARASGGRCRLRTRPGWFKQVPLVIGEEGDGSAGPEGDWPPCVTPGSYSGSTASSSEPAATPHRLSFDMWRGNVSCRARTCPGHLNVVPTGSGLVWSEDRGLEQGEAEDSFLHLFIRWVAVAWLQPLSKAALLVELPSPGLVTSGQAVVTVPAVVRAQVLHHLLSVSLTTASGFEHNLFTHPFSHRSV